MMARWCFWHKTIDLHVKLEDLHQLDIEKPLKKKKMMKERKKKKRWLKHQQDGEKRARPMREKQSLSLLLLNNAQEVRQMYIDDRDTN